MGRFHLMCAFAEPIQTCLDCQTPFETALGRCPTCGAEVGDRPTPADGPGLVAKTEPGQSAAVAPGRTGNTTPGGPAAPQGPIAQTPPPTGASVGPPATPSMALKALHAGQRKVRTGVTRPGHARRFSGVIAGPTNLSSRPVPFSPILLGLAAIGGLVYFDQRYLDGTASTLLLVLVTVMLPFCLLFIVWRLFSSRGRPSGAQGLDVTSFRLMTSDGDSYDCRLFGSIDNGSLRSGDEVEVLGIIRRDRTIRASQVSNVKTGAIVRPLPPFSYRLVQIAQVVLAICLPLMTLGVIVGLALN